MSLKSKLSAISCQPIKKCLTKYLQKNQPDPLPDFENQVKNQYIGRWFIIHRQHPTQHTLEIKKDLSISLDNSPFPYTLISMSSSQLLIRDKNGYLLTLTCQNQVPITIHDEADDRTYDVSK